MSWSTITDDELDPLDLRYAGGKGLAGLWQWICSQLPPHVDYVENFVGKGGVFRKKTPALHSTLIDRDPAVIRWWEAQKPTVKDPIAGAVEVRGNRQPRRGTIDHRQSRRERPPSHTTLICACGIEWLERAVEDESVGPETLVYGDPPYHPSTRSHLRLYRCEMSDRDHRRYLRAANRARFPMVISGYMCDLYADRLSKWKLKTRKVITRGRTFATECLWANAPAAEASAIGMTYHELGEDWRTRDRVSKLRKRWREDYASRPPNERRALLLELLSVEAELSQINADVRFVTF